MTNKTKKILFYLLLLQTFGMYANRTSLLIKIPTRARPHRFFKTLDTYYQNLSFTMPYQFLISCDSDDATMNNEEVITRLKSYPNLVFSFTNNNSKVQAYNRDINPYDFDVLIATSDDMIAVQKDFDVIIMKIMHVAFPDFDGVLHFFDGVVGRSCNTLPIMGNNYYKRFGYVYNPAYRALVCNVEFTSVSKMLKKEKVIDTMLFQHCHPAWGLAPSDDLYLKNEQYHAQDKDTFIKRRTHSFDLPTQDLERVSPKIWSILICTIEEREQSMAQLSTKLIQQIEALGLQNQIEVLAYKDKRAEHTIGHKRNILLEESKGKYISYIDDDDDIHDRYIQMIYEKLILNPDCVSLNGIITFNGANPKRFIHSICYNMYAENESAYTRPPNHLNPIRRSIAVQFPFSEKNFGEDTEWALDIARSKLLQKEEVIEEPYYFYLCNE